MEGAIREVNAFSTFAFDILKEIYLYFETAFKRESCELC